jgi:hypothetical protein
LHLSLSFSLSLSIASDFNFLSLTVFIRSSKGNLLTLTVHSIDSNSVSCQLTQLSFVISLHLACHFILGFNCI